MATDPLPEGWLSDAEADELARLARGRVVLELGAWKGRSTVVLASTAAYVVSVDAHKPFVSFGERFPADSLPEYLDNVRGLLNAGIVIADFSFAALFNPSAFDLVFVDGLHDVASVTSDLILASRFHGTIALHDWGRYEVVEAVSQLNGWSPPNRVVENLAVFDRRR